MKSKRKLGLVAVMAGMMALVIILGAGGIGTATEPADPAACYCTMPELSLSTTNVYWNSVADYNNDVLSVDYNISNTSANYANAKDLQIMGTANSMGVTSIDNGRLVNMVPAGECEEITLKYSVPTGVGAFSTTVYAETSDQCGTTYAYPGTYPGP